MSVEIYGVKGNNIYDAEAETLYSAGVSAQKFYDTVWERGIAETGVKIFQDGRQFDRTQLDAVIKELKGLYEWGEKNLTGTDKSYLQSKTKYLIDDLPRAFEIDKNMILYIF